MNLLKTLVATAAVTATAAGSPARAADGTTFLLTVAVSSTPKMPSFRAMPNADKTATGLHRALMASVPNDRRNDYRLAWTDVKGAPNPTSNHPTVANVRTVLELFARDATKQDRILVVFLGHGFHTVGDAKNGAPEYDAVVLGDSDLTDPKSFLSVAEIFGRVAATKCKDGAVFIDACRDYRDDLKVDVDPAYRPTGKTFADDLDRKERQTDRGRRVCLVQACEAGTYAYEEDDTKGGLMTESLALALSKTRDPKEGTADLDGDGTVTIHEAVGYARTREQIHARNRHRTVQKLTDEPAAEAFALATVDKPAVGGGNTVADSGGQPNRDRVGPQPPPLGYAGLTASLQGGPPPSPANQSYGRGGGGYVTGGGINGGIAYGQGLPGVAFGGGINPQSAGGQVLDGLRHAGVPYLPPTGTPLINYGLGFIRR